MSGEAVIGLMDAAYFVSKNELLRWINQTLQLDITFIEDLGSGSIYCQLIDAYFKQTVPMAKVNWQAKFEYEFVGNLKLYQKGLEKIGVTKKIDVNKLAKAKYQDNLEMIQWLKRYLELTTVPLTDYQPLQRRNHESFLSHHSQKNSFIHKPARSNTNVSFLNTTLTSNLNTTLQNGKEGQQNKLQTIRKILKNGDTADRKLQLIGQLVGYKQALNEKETNVESQMQMID